MIPNLKRIKNFIENTRCYLPSHARFIIDQVIGRKRNARAGHSDEDHLLAAAAWLERAQDETTDGGVSGRYRLDSGWTSSYPETTGYTDLAATGGRTW
jgi:hypothetical protein